MYNCPKCKSPFEKGEKSCETCGFDLEKGFIYDPICPRCGKKYPDGSRFCMVDDIKLISFKDFTPRCVLCQRPFTPDVAICPYDGGPIRPIIGGQSPTRGFIQYNTQPAYYSEQEGYVYSKASSVSRFGASFMDGFFQFLFALPLIMILGLLFAARPKGAWIIYDILIGLFLLAAFLVPFTYILIKDGLNNGQSWGKKEAGLMVVDLETNMPCSIKKSVQRNLFLMIPFLSYWEHLKILSHPKGQREGDLFCNTQVIEIDQYDPHLNKQAGKDKL